MGDSVLLPQIRNLKNVADLRRKQKQLRESLQTGIKVDNDADVSLKIAAQQVRQNVLPIMPNEELVRNAERDEIGQYNTALQHLKSIMPAFYATQVLREGLLGDTAGIAEFNRFWPGFQKYIANFGNLTPNYFREYWQRYRRLLLQGGVEDVPGPSLGAISPAPRSPVYGPRNRRNLTPFPETPDVIIPNLPEKEKQLVLRSSPLGKNPVNEPTTISLVRSPQVQIKRRSYSDNPASPYYDKRLTQEAGLPTRVIQTYGKVKQGVQNWVLDWLSGKPKTQTPDMSSEARRILTLRGSTDSEARRTPPKAIKEQATKITPILNNLQVDGPTITTLAIAIGAYSLLAVDVDVVQTATDFVRENAGRTKEFLLRKAYELMARAVYGPDVAQGLVAWQNNVAVLQGRGISAPNEPRYDQFGCYLIHVPSLEKNRINIKFPSLASHPRIPQRVASTELIALIKKILETGQMNAPLYAALTEEDKKYFDSLAHMCKIGGKLGIVSPKDDEDMQRFQIVRGEILSGNDAPQLIKELKHLTLKLVTEGKIPKRSAHDLLIEISLL